MKLKQRGGRCTNWSYTGRSIAPGIFERSNMSTDCHSGGGKKKSKKARPAQRKSTTKRLSRKKVKQVEEIINKLCKSMKKCTPKYKRVLKKIVIENM